MGNGVSPAGSRKPGISSWLCCCTVESDCNSFGCLSAVEGIHDEARGSSQVPPKWVASNKPYANTNGQAPYYIELDNKADALLKSAELDGKAVAKKSNYDVDDADAEATTADSATPARLTPPSPNDSPSEFGGSWLCMAVTGDMEGFLKDMGVAEGPRRAASAARYGALRQVQNITQSADSFVVDNILDKPVTMRFVVGEGVQKTLDQEGKPILIEPLWDGEVLCVVSKRENGDLIANSRRYIDGADMILELRSPSGVVVRRKFQRRLIFEQQ